MADQFFEYTCPQCGAGKAHPRDASPPNCEACDGQMKRWEEEMKCVSHGAIIPTFVIVVREVGKPNQAAVVSEHSTLEEREVAFNGFLEAKLGVCVSDYTEYGYAEKHLDGSLHRWELWAMHTPYKFGAIERETLSLEEIQTGIREILLDGGYVNAQKNRCIPREGSALKEILTRKFCDALWTMKDLVQYAPPSRLWYAGPWGLPDVTPDICRGNVSSASRSRLCEKDAKLVEVAILQNAGITVVDASAFTLPATIPESFAAGFNECMRLVHAAGFVPSTSFSAAS